MSASPIQPRIGQTASSSTRPGNNRPVDNRPPTASSGSHCSSNDGALGRLAAGDNATWRDTVDRYERLVRFSARAVVRCEADVDEVVQRTWVLLLRNARGINDFGRLAGWLAITARREALAIVRAQQRETPRAELPDFADETDIATRVLSRELVEALYRAIDVLPATQRTLIRAMLCEPASYDALSAELRIPRGSLGPLRGRAIRALREQLQPSFA
jgi:RNA polymerase sigma factor (sigma-70 family)